MRELSPREISKLRSGSLGNGPKGPLRTNVIAPLVNGFHGDLTNIGNSVRIGMQNALQNTANVLIEVAGTIMDPIGLKR